jgi:type II secretory pathway component GspD/PulD (secretin)
MQNPVQNMPQIQQTPQGSSVVSSAGNTTTYQAPPPPKISTPKITIFLKQIPLLTALDIILRTKGLKYKIEKDFIWISTADKLAMEDLVTRIYTIQHAIGEFANFETEALDLSALNISTGDNLASQFFNQSGGSAQVYNTSQPQQEKSQAQAAEDLVSTLSKIIPQPQGASMTLYQRTGKLIVRNTPKNLRLLEGLLRNLDVSSLQVSIEVRLVEVSALDGLDIGQTFSWEKFNPSTTTRQTIASETLQQGFGRALAANTGGFSYVLNKTSPEEVDISIQALVAKNRATILSAPKLTCLNNQTANLKIVRNTSYIASNKAYSNTTDGVTSVSSSQNIGQVPEGIVLQITPNVSADRKTIRLTVHPQVTELLDMEVYESGDTQTQLPSISQRSLDTTVSISNSGTLVLGGLMRGSERKTERGIPVLSSVPVVGNFFKNHNKTKDRDNLIIFITASILNADGDLLDIQIEEKSSEIK